MAAHATPDMMDPMLSMAPCLWVRCMIWSALSMGAGVMGGAWVVGASRVRAEAEQGWPKWGRAGRGVGRAGACMMKLLLLLLGLLAPVVSLDLCLLPFLGCLGSCFLSCLCLLLLPHLQTDGSSPCSEALSFICRWYAATIPCTSPPSEPHQDRCIVFSLLRIFLILQELVSPKHLESQRVCHPV